MKILHISIESPEEDEILGGRGIFLKNVLKREKNEIRLLTFGASATELDGYKLEQMRQDFLLPRPEGYIGMLKDINFRLYEKGVDVLNEWKPDIIHLHDSDAGEAALALKRTYNIPVVYTMHLSANYTLRHFYNAPLQEYLAQMEHNLLMNMVPHVDAVQVCSQGYRDLFHVGSVEGMDLSKEMYWTDKPVYSVPNGVSSDFDNAGSDLPKDRKVFFAGRFAVGKGIETICELIPEMPDYTFYFAGQFNGSPTDADKYPTSKVLLDTQKEYPDRVKLLGHIRPHSRIGSVARQCDVWVAPSWHCPFELVGLEAMACGVPLVATKTGAFLEYCNEDNSILVEPKNKDCLKLGIEQAVADRDRLIKGGLETVKKYTWENTVTGINKIYEDVKK